MEAFTTERGCSMFVSMRRVIAALVVVGLAIGVFLLWPRTEPDDPPNTVASPSTTTTSTSIAETTTSVAGTTSTTDDGSHVVETVEEAEAILRELWFGWFEGIYNQDEDRIREVVGNPEVLQNAVDAFGTMEFDGPPTSDAISIDAIELLRSDAGCLAVWAEVSAGFRPGSISGVHVFRSVDQAWFLINTWPLRGDMWESDCDTELQP